MSDFWGTPSTSVQCGGSQQIVISISIKNSIYKNLQKIKVRLYFPPGVIDGQLIAKSSVTTITEPEQRYIDQGYIK